MAVKPIDLPSAAGVPYGEGDVRHFSQGDSFDVPSVANPTRHLADRDNKLAEKVNEIVEVVNNKEQFVPLLIPRTLLPPNDSIIVTNYRIPAGFEARILNATIASTPLSADIELNVYYSTGFGNTTGDVVVSISDETSSGTSFKQSGEYVIEIKNKGGLSLDIVGSLLLTMRPLGEVGTPLVASVIQGDKGNPGEKGDKGDPGPAGTGGAGSPGMVWDDAWVSGKNYTPPLVVSFPLNGTNTSSFICRQAHLSDNSNKPPNATYWSTVALASTGTVIVVTGAVASGIPVYATQILSGTVVPDVNYLAGTTHNGYTGSLTASGTTTFPFDEFSIVSTSTNVPNGMAFLQANFRRSFTGNLKIYLPTAANGAKVDWDSGNTICQATLNGTTQPQITANGTLVHTVEVKSGGGNDYIIQVNAPTPQKVSIMFVGHSTVP